MLSRDRMISVYALVLIALLAQGYDPTTDSVIVKGSAGLHAFRVDIANQAFDPTKYGLRPVKRTSVETGNPTMEGRFAWGGYGPHSAEIRSFRIAIDGRQILLPRTAYFDCFDLFLRPTARAWLTRDGLRLRIKVDGSASTTGYSAVWDVTRRGHWTRSIYDQEEVPMERRTADSFWQRNPKRGWIKRWPR